MHGLFHLVDSTEIECFSCETESNLTPVEHRDYATGIPHIMLKCMNCGKLLMPPQSMTGYSVKEDESA